MELSAGVARQYSDISVVVLLGTHINFRGGKNGQKKGESQEAQQTQNSFRLCVRCPALSVGFVPLSPVS